MAQSNLTTLDALLKNVYIPGLPSWVNNQRPLSGRIQQITDKKRFTGRKFIMGALNAEAEGTGALSESETLPVAVAPEPVNMELTMKHYYAVAKLSAQVIASGNSNEGAFADTVTTTLDSIRNRMEEDLAIDMLFGEGSGRRGTTASTSSSTTLNLQDQTTVGALGSRLVRKNMLLSVYTAISGGSNEVDGISVSNVPTSGTATMASAVTASAASIAFRAVTPGTDPRNKAMMGLFGIVDDGTALGTFQTLSRTTYPSLKANKLGNSGTLRAITQDLMDTLAGEAWLNGGGAYPTAFYSPIEIQRRICSSIRADRTFDISVKTYKGGYAGIEWQFPGGAAPWFCDRFCTPNRVLAVHEPDLFLAVQEDVQFEERDGSMWRFTGRTHDVEAWMFTWRNLGSRRCNNHSYLNDISHTL